MVLDSPSSSDSSSSSSKEYGLLVHCKSMESLPTSFRCVLNEEELNSFLVAVSTYCLDPIIASGKKYIDSV